MVVCQVSAWWWHSSSISTIHFFHTNSRPKFNIALETWQLENYFPFIVKAFSFQGQHVWFQGGYKMYKSYGRRRCLTTLSLNGCCRWAVPYSSQTPTLLVTRRATCTCRSVPRVGPGISDHDWPFEPVEIFQRVKLSKWKWWTATWGPSRCCCVILCCFFWRCVKTQN